MNPANALRGRASALGLVCVLGFVACEIADRDIVEDPSTAGSSSAGDHGGGSPGQAGNVGNSPGGGADAGEASGGTAHAGTASLGGTGGEVEPGTAGAAPGGAGGEPGVVTCSPACEGEKPICDAGTCVEPQSCAGLTQNCGANLADSCCGVSGIPEGSFKRSYDAVDETDDTNSANISAFSCDLLEVTVGRFRRFVEAGFGHQGSPPAAGSGAVPGSPSSGWKSEWDTNLAVNKGDLVSALQCLPGYFTWTISATAADARPINCVTWYEAQAFCIWDGGRLLTEAEWNYVAAHGNEQRLYPWSSPASSKAISAALASYYVDNTKKCYGDGVDGCSGADIVVAGKKSGLGFWLQRDLGGNLQEWVLDYYAPAYPNPCQDCVQTTGNPYRVLRGGGFNTTDAGLTSSVREMSEPFTRASDIGFRCAYGR